MTSRWIISPPLPPLAPPPPRHLRFRSSIPHPRARPCSPQHCAALLLPHLVANLVIAPGRQSRELLMITTWRRPSSPSSALAHPRSPPLLASPHPRRPRRRRSPPPLPPPPPRRRWRPPPPPPSSPSALACASAPDESKRRNVSQSALSPQPYREGALEHSKKGEPSIEQATRRFDFAALRLRRDAPAFENQVVRR